jgi:predicted GH43/DUF377 family glycosyl hydrolase
MAIQVRRHDILLPPESARVIVRAFIPPDGAGVAGTVDRALALTEWEVVRRLRAVHEAFGPRHHDLQPLLMGNYAKVRRFFTEPGALSLPRRMLIGALFSGEYALESAALFNPSIVPHPDQDGLPAGALRFIMSLRATGEGHISSIEFREGVLSPQGELSFAPVSPRVATPALLDAQGPADASYQVRFPAGLALCERALVPVSANEKNGIEDARFVRFLDDDGSATYYATYTAYDGRNILPRLIETHDFLSFRMPLLTGDAVRDKGMALFPRRVGGRYAMLSRQDGENLFIMFSDHPHDWSRPAPLLGPAQVWESSKVGNCGSPLETESGWLVITHGVGPMRKYCIGAVLLDLEDPTRIIGRLREPLLEPEGDERIGYVPNVVYSCGSLLHGGRLILPYAMSDKASAVASVDLAELLSALGRA